MDLEQIKTFIYVSITKSFRQAGKILYVSQPTVSSRIKALEKDVGFLLFSRKGSSITLTPEGEALLPYVQKSIENIEDGLTAVHKVNSEVRRELGISIVLTMSNYLLPVLIRRFQCAYPEIKLTIRTGHSNNVLDMVLNREVSLGIVRSVSHPNIKPIHLIDDELVLAVYPSHPFTSRKIIQLEKVKDEPLILFNHGSIDWTLINDTFNKLNIRPNIIMEVDNINLAKQMIMNRAGIGILPRSSIGDALAAGSLSKVEICDLPKLSRPFQLIYLNDKVLGESAKVFADFITREIHLYT